MWLGVMRRLMPDVDDLFAYIDVVAETLGAHYRPRDMYLSTKLTAVASLDAGITTIIDACHSSRSPEHTDAALDALHKSGIRALHMVGAAMDKKASSAHLPSDLKRLAIDWNQGDNLVRVGLFGQLNLDWWKVARSLDMRILTEFIGDLAKLGPEFAEPGILGPHNIFNHCTRSLVAWRRVGTAFALWLRDHARRMNCAGPSSRIRLSALTAIATSALRRSSARDLRASPMTRL